MNNYIEQALNEITVDCNSKSSIYYNKDGNKVPRVTEIISRMIHNDSLMYWANSLGFKGLRYRDELNKAANLGTEAHSSIEKFLKEKIKTESNIPFMGFLLWYDIISDSIPIDIIYSEHALTCDWFGGTLDCLAKIGNKVFLIDFKTSNHVTFNYFLQLSAYLYMLKVVEGINCDGVIVLQLNKLEPGFNEYLLDFSIPEHLDFINNCENAFLSLVYAYYNIESVEKQYKKIF